MFGADGVTIGASNDLQQVRKLARRMVTQFGYASEQSGLAGTSWEPAEGSSPGMKYSSAATEQAIDEEVKRIVAMASKTCRETLQRNRKLLDELTEALMEKETVDYIELYEMVGKYHPEAAEAQKPNFPPSVSDEPAADMAVA